MKNLVMVMMAVGMAAGMAKAEDEGKRLQALAKAAVTPAAHADVARGYRDWARELDAKADKHEAEADRLAKDTGYYPMRHKWPALAAAPAEREKRLAMQARRAAREARELAVKAEAKGGPVAGE